MSVDTKRSRSEMNSIELSGQLRTNYAEPLTAGISRIMFLAQCFTDTSPRISHIT